MSKILVEAETGKVKHSVSDAGEIITMGNFLTMIMEQGERPIQNPFFHNGNAVVFEGVELPQDEVIYDKYCYDGNTFIIADDWVEPVDENLTTEEEI